MKLFKILSHIADVRLQIEASTLEELFSVALEGMNSILKSNAYRKKDDFKIEKEVTLSSIDLTSLLIDFMSEVLTYTYEEKAIFSKVEFIKLEDKELSGIVYGENVQGFDEDIKAVTYHEAEVKKNKKGNWETIIVFDI